MWYNTIGHRFSHVVQLREGLGEAKMRIVKHVKAHVVVNVRNAREIEGIGIFVVELAIEQTPALRQFEESFALVQFNVDGTEGTALSSLPVSAFGVTLIATG